MPAVATIALDRLIDRDSGVVGAGGDRSVAAGGRRKAAMRFNISPHLYATPEPTRISGCSSTVADSPSPYVLDYKRRGVSPVAAEAAAAPAADAKLVGEVEVELKRGQGSEDVVPGGGRLENGLEENLSAFSLGEGGVYGVVNKQAEGKAKEGFLEHECNGTGMDDDEFSDFLECRGSMSAASSSSDSEDRKVGDSFGRRRLLESISFSNQTEFYDAPDDFSMDSPTSQPSLLYANIEADLRSVRLSLFDEINTRKRLEERLAHMRNQWKRMAEKISEVGLTFPPVPDVENMQSELEGAEHFCQELVVARNVSEAVGRGLARAEAESAAEALIETKNREIARLHDRLKYYEAMNHEMSQRNQEAVELARQKRQKRRMRQRLIWGSIGVSISVAASILAYSYIPQSTKSMPTDAGECSDATLCSGSAETRK